MSGHIKLEVTKIVVSAYYLVHSEDRRLFIEAVIPDMKAAAGISGCIYYVFAEDLIDSNLFHLSEAYKDESAYKNHARSEAFLNALNFVMKNVRVLDRQAVRYEVSGQQEISPESLSGNS